MTISIINIIYYLINSITLLTLILGNISMYKHLNNYTFYIYKYKINNFRRSFIIVFIYIFLYCLCLYKMGQFIDLKVWFEFLDLIWILFLKPLALETKIYSLLIQPNNISL